MESSNIFKFDHYNLFITVLNQKQLQITVIDPIQQFKFHQGLVILQNITTTTFIRALEKSVMQVKMAIQVNKKEENTFLQIDIVVASQFLKPVEETILIKEYRHISQYEILKTQIGNLSSKFKIIKQNNNVGPHKVRCQSINGEKSFNSKSPETIARLTLPKGKYLITLSFLAKMMSSWIYLYFQLDQSFIQNDGFYVESMSNYMPFVVKKQYRVTQNEENVEFSTNYANSYPLLLKNIVISALEVS